MNTLRRLWVWLTRRSVGGRIDPTAGSLNRQARMRFNDPEEVWEMDLPLNQWVSLITGERVNDEVMWPVSYLAQFRGEWFLHALQQRIAYGYSYAIKPPTDLFIIEGEA